jgi:N-acetylmuramoyl-L-alanine amidase
MASALYRAFREYKSEIEGVTFSQEIVKSKPKTEVIATTVETVLETSKETKKEKKEKAKNTSKEEITGLNYRIQFSTNSQPVEIKPENFKGLTEVDEYISNGLYKYTTGISSNYETAKMLQAEIRDLGYKDAFIIAFNGNKRLDLREALGMEKK